MDSGTEPPDGDGLVEVRKAARDITISMVRPQRKRGGIAPCFQTRAGSKATGHNRYQRWRQAFRLSARSATRSGTIFESPAGVRRARREKALRL